jgi:hypothetical protein
MDAGVFARISGRRRRVGVRGCSGDGLPSLDTDDELSGVHPPEYMFDGNTPENKQKEESTDDNSKSFITTSDTVYVSVEST